MKPEDPGVLKIAALNAVMRFRFDEANFFFDLYFQNSESRDKEMLIKAAEVDLKFKNKEAESLRLY